MGKARVAGLLVERQIQLGSDGKPIKPQAQVSTLDRLSTTFGAALLTGALAAGSARGSQVPRQGAPANLRCGDRGYAFVIWLGTDQERYPASTLGASPVMFTDMTEYAGVFRTTPAR
jgi:hypothetical protein